MIESPPDSAAPAPAAVAPVADGVERSLDPAYIPLQQVVGWIVFAVFGSLSFVALLVAVFATPLVLWVKPFLVVGWFSILLLLWWLAQRWPEIEYRHFRYRVDGEGIEIRRGVVWRKVISVPRSRVQHIDVIQGPLDRRYGLSRLFIHTAGTEFAKVELPGLEYATAVRLRDHLLPGRTNGANDGL